MAPKSHPSRYYCFSNMKLRVYENFSNLLDCQLSTACQISSFKCSWDKTTWIFSIHVCSQNYHNANKALSNIWISRQNIKPLSSLGTNQVRQSQRIMQNCKGGAKKEEYSLFFFFLLSYYCVFATHLSSKTNRTARSTLKEKALLNARLVLPPCKFHKWRGQTDQ